MAECASGKIFALSGTGVSLKVLDLADLDTDSLAPYVHRDDREGRAVV